MNEFDVIKQYFTRQKAEQSAVLAIGDDCAVIELEPQQQLAITTDTLVAGTHFLPDISPYDLAYKSVAVNLSDLAAMGAMPKWISLALTLPKVDDYWLTEFSKGLFAILDHYNVELIGGDTTKGALSITITAQGVLEKGAGLYRHKAQLDDLIFVSGTLGDSKAGLALLFNQTKNETEQQEYLLQRHLNPTPRIELGLLLNQYSQCAIDISDGLLADLGHILERSQCGAELNLQDLPLSLQLVNEYPRLAETFALTGGEDYELCFTIAPDKVEAFKQAIAHLDIKCSCIGKITQSGLTLLREGKEEQLPVQAGFDHFS
ncbi:thiamine-phosphate kinase [Pasteurella skyensis]|uniref:Thiamine-monophosphate kinase n=1 Tax=Phocoenobacter skyensis TaxID=97481 RepID=A0AAJ6N8J9_9PAST|nr:thiamine-phosphate kinase [Pasteurella skyensis]MDP8162036.1 thiamine-phosphate kinase [Pasteurella skyensis]MDP8172192.1 thiamine-phosphate kinase [Pasteurella skyensis]MDP8176460.1 thiamine-phosphate kinase [Pasteurella skyensis]MDP8178348.1 thiamine-phosphate kinase [Pasteurella skyensis]MDP8182896.1 thiamine-phosphate kinase [Pasteurella skyensis]